VIGPAGRSIVESVTGAALEDSPYAFRRLQDSLVLRADLGFLILASREVSAAVLQRALDAGAVSAGYDTWNVLRAEAGLPLYGVDVDDTTTLPELGERGISYDKGCYIGQEVVAKIKYIGHVNRKFVGFLCSGEVIPEAGSAVRAGGKEAGRVTTAVWSLGLNRPIALGFVGRAFAVPGTAVELAGKQQTVAATVSGLPF
jgi:folate-binding protein YgfZ